MTKNMGLTIVQKSKLSKANLKRKVALVLAGGAITGGTYKVGGLIALNDFLVNRKVTDFDIYVGVSAGGFLSVPLAGGISPEEILKSLDGSSNRFKQLSPLHFYTPNLEEYIKRPLGYFYKLAKYLPGICMESLSSMNTLWGPFSESLSRFANSPSYSKLEEMLKPFSETILSKRPLPSLSESVPSGIFDSKPLEAYLEKNMKQNKLPNNFKTLKRLIKKSLYVVSTELDSGERVIFGADENNSSSVSKAVQASCALPFLYKPVNIGGKDYVDGGICRTASIDVAIEKGAGLTICYNPFRPYSADSMKESMGRNKSKKSQKTNISQHGIFMILNQVFRTVYHSRIQDYMKQLKHNKNFKGDIILIEPKEDDSIFFEMNPLSFWQRGEAAKHGFLSIRDTIHSKYSEVSKILNSYGIKTTKMFTERNFEHIVKAA